MKRTLFVVTKPPYAGAHNVEVIEAAMVAAVFDFDVALLFRGEGIRCLLPDQDGALLGRRTVGKLLAALPAHEIDRCYVCAEAMAATGLDPAAFVVRVEVVDAARQAELIRAQDAVIGAQA